MEYNFAYINNTNGRLTKLMFVLHAAFTPRRRRTFRLEARIVKQREGVGILEPCRYEYMGKKPLSRHDDLAFRRG